MSKSNILKSEKLPGGRVRITFDAKDGERTYEFGKVNAAAFHKGQDPSELHGRLVEHKKKDA
jgi:hypothetical protein